MTAVRRLLAQRHLAMLLCAATLALKLLVPTGYMIANAAGVPAIVVCPGMVSGDAAMPAHAMSAAMPGHGTGHGPAMDHGKPEMPCAFAGLSFAAHGAAEPPSVALPVTFAAPAHWHASGHPLALVPEDRRPPSRGPPVTR